MDLQSSTILTHIPDYKSRWNSEACRGESASGSIGLCGGSYCRRPSSVGGRASAAQWQIANLPQQEQVIFKKAKVEIQQSRRDGAEAIPGPAAGPNGPKLVPSVPPGSNTPSQNGCIWYQ